MFDTPAQTSREGLHSDYQVRPSLVSDGNGLRSTELIDVNDDFCLGGESE